MEGFNGGPSDIYNYSRNNNIFGDANNSNSAGYIREQELDKYRYIHPYMYERELTDKIIERFDIDVTFARFNVYDKALENIIKEKEKEE